MQSCKLIDFDGAFGSKDFQANVTIRDIEVEHSTVRINRGDFAGFVARSSKVVFTTDLRDVTMVNSTSDRPVICDQRSGPWARLEEGVEFEFDLTGNWNCLWHYMFRESQWRVWASVEGNGIVKGFLLAVAAFLVSAVCVDELRVGVMLRVLCSVVSTVFNIDGIVRALYRIMTGSNVQLRFVLPLVVAVGCFGAQAFMSVR